VVPRGLQFLNFGGVLRGTRYFIGVRFSGFFDDIMPREIRGTTEHSAIFSAIWRTSEFGASHVWGHWFNPSTAHHFPEMPKSRGTPQLFAYLSGKTRTQRI